MFKDRIKKWGLDKKNKERDMVAILRKKTEREAVGKGTSFRVRGQVVTMENVLQYFKRKKDVRGLALSAASTPSDVSCWTPSPVHTPRPMDDGTQPKPTDDGSSGAPLDPYLPLALAKDTMGAGAVDGDWPIAMPLVSMTTSIQSSINNFFECLLDCSSTPRSPSSPDNLLVQEQLFSRY